MQQREIIASLYTGFSPMEIAEDWGLCCRTVLRQVRKEIGEGDKPSKYWLGARAKLAFTLNGLGWYVDEIAYYMRCSVDTVRRYYHRQPLGRPPLIVLVSDPVATIHDERVPSGRYEVNAIGSHLCLTDLSNYETYITLYRHVAGSVRVMNKTFRDAFYDLRATRIYT